MGDLALFAEAFDTEFDDIAGFEVDGSGLDAEADTGRGSGADDIAWEQGHEVADIAHELGDFEDHLCGAAVLPFEAIDGEPHFEVVRVLEFVWGREERPERSEGIGAFAFDPLAAAFELPLAFAVVVVERVAGNVIESVGLADVAGSFSDDDGEFDFPIGFDGPSGDDERIVRACERGGGFEEEDGFLGDLCSGLLGVVGVVQPDADDFAGANDTRSETGVGIDGWRVCAVGCDPGAEPLEAIGAEERFVVVGAEGGDVDTATIGKNDAGFFLIGVSESNEFHKLMCGLCVSGV